MCVLCEIRFRNIPKDFAFLQKPEFLKNLRILDRACIHPRQQTTIPKRVTPDHAGIREFVETRTEEHSEALQCSPGSQGWPLIEKFRGVMESRPAFSLFRSPVLHCRESRETLKTFQNGHSARNGQALHDERGYVKEKFRFVKEKPKFSLDKTFLFGYGQTDLVVCLRCNTDARKHSVSFGNFLTA